MTILLAFPSSAMSFFLIFVLLELDSDLSTKRQNLNGKTMSVRLTYRKKDRQEMEKKKTKRD